MSANEPGTVGPRRSQEQHIEAGRDRRRVAVRAIEDELDIGRREWLVGVNEKMKFWAAPGWISMGVSGVPIS